MKEEQGRIHDWQIVSCGAGATAGGLTMAVMHYEQIFKYMPYLLPWSRVFATLLLFVLVGAAILIPVLISFSSLNTRDSFSLFCKGYFAGLTGTYVTAFIMSQI